MRNQQILSKDHITIGDAELQKQHRNMTKDLSFRYMSMILHIRVFFFLLFLLNISLVSCDEEDYYQDYSDITNNLSPTTTLPDNEESGIILKIERYMSQNWGSTNLQGGDCYGDFFFQFENHNNRVFISNLKTKDFIGTVSMSSNSNNHCNNVSFSRIFYNVDDEFPLLYVSGSQSGTYNNIQVYRISRDDNVFSFIKVQEIVLPENGSINKLYWTGAVMDNENNYMYIYANSIGAQIAKFEIPDIKQEEVYLTGDDILEQFSLPGFTHQQGAVIKNGLMYVMDGVPQVGDTNYLRIIDLVNKVDFDKIDISALGYGNIEFESLSYYEGFFITASNCNRGVFSINFLKR